MFLIIGILLTALVVSGLLQTDRNWLFALVGIVLSIGALFRITAVLRSPDPGGGRKE
ncbi:hypothetical protein [Alkalicoccus urumqiensis]|uniref:hypothetical protein n=1 Tax=Alkalicoccus urumqiensis TaxID=1548213 RepID=UPI0015E5B740|nr:hypothetical protein [Alkalicoccus urumqiensis]